MLDLESAFLSVSSSELCASEV